MYPTFDRSPEGFPAAQVSPNVICCLESYEGYDGLFIVSHTSSKEIAFSDLPVANKTTIERAQGIEDFRAYATAVADHYKELTSIDRKTYEAKTSTPWGQAQMATRYAPGIISYGTSGHGGFKVASGKNQLIPHAYRNYNGWYEEDSDWACVAVSFPEYFTSFEVQEATKIIINQHPDEYEHVTGETIQPGQSRVRDQQIFDRENARNWVVIAALSSDEHDGMVECVATLGGARSGFYDGEEITVEEREFLVPHAEYKNRGQTGFVIDEARHEAVTTLPGFSM